jgi:hypothetical protein
MNNIDKNLIFAGFLLLLFANILFIQLPVQGDVTINEYIYALSVHSNDDAEGSDGHNLAVWGEGAGLKQTWAAASQYVTGPGGSELVSSSSQGDGYKINSELRYNGVGAAWDTLAVNSCIPNESGVDFHYRG